MPPCDGMLCWEGVSDLMNMQVRVGPSRIAGQGLFAAQDITKGTRIIQYIGARIPKAVSVERVARGMRIFLRSTTAMISTARRGRIRRAISTMPVIRTVSWKKRVIPSGL